MSGGKYHRHFAMLTRWDGRKLSRYIVALPLTFLSENCLLLEMIRKRTLFMRGIIVLRKSFVIMKHYHLSMYAKRWSLLFSCWRLKKILPDCDRITPRFGLYALHDLAGESFVMAGRNVPLMRLTAILYTPSGIHCRRWIGASHLINVTVLHTFPSQRTFSLATANVQWLIPTHFVAMILRRITYNA